MHGDPHDDETLGLTPRTSLLQFRLSSLLLAVAVCSGLLATLVTLGTLWSAMVFFVGVLIAAHVAGNVIGTRLREQASRARRVSAPGLAAMGNTGLQGSVELLYSSRFAFPSPSGSSTLSPTSESTQA